MKMLYIGPRKGTEKMKEINRENFPNLEMDFIQYQNYFETPRLLEEYTGKIDAILFGGKTPFKAFETIQRDNPILCDYIPRHDTTLYRALLEAIYLQKKSIDRLSLDTYDRKTTKRIFREIGIAFEEEQMFFAEQKLEKRDYAEYVADFHRKLYQEDRVDQCITGLEEVYYILCKEEIPVTYCLPSETIMIQSIKNLQLRWLAKKNSENQIVVVAVKLNMPSEYSLMKEDEYAYLSQRVKILEKLYYFSSRLDGVLIEQGKSEFMIFTTKKNIELETKNYKDIYLLDLLREVSVISVHVGIGYGKTANESKYNAYESIKMAQRHGQSAVYVVLENGEVMGPVEASTKKKRKETFDEKFYQISRETGLSVNTIHRIFSNVAKEKRREFTSKELAALCGVSIRTMDRIVLKLCDAGYCEVISEKLMSRYGRPSRILRFKPILPF